MTVFLVFIISNTIRRRGTIAITYIGMAIWYPWVVPSTEQISYDCMFLSCHVRVSEWIRELSSCGFESSCSHSNFLSPKNKWSWWYYITVKNISWYCRTNNSNIMKENLFTVLKALPASINSAASVFPCLKIECITWIAAWHPASCRARLEVKLMMKAHFT